MNINVLKNAFDERLSDRRTVGWRTDGWVNRIADGPHPTPYLTHPDFRPACELERGIIMSVSEVNGLRVLDSLFHPIGICYADEQHGIVRVYHIIVLALHGGTPVGLRDIFHTGWTAGASYQALIKISIEIQT